MNEVTGVHHLIIRGEFLGGNNVYYGNNHSNFLKVQRDRVDHFPFHLYSYLLEDCLVLAIFPKLHRSSLYSLVRTVPLQTDVSAVIYNINYSEYFIYEVFSLISNILSWILFCFVSFGFL